MVAFEFLQWMIAENPIIAGLAIFWLPWPAAFAVGWVATAVKALIVEVLIVVLGRRAEVTNSTES